MPDVNKSVLIDYSAERMFDLVDAVERYPEFLPWCGAATAVAVDASRVRASVTINYHGVKQRFTTENARVRPKEIEMQLVEGPFRALQGSWRFVHLNERACKVEFRLHYEFSSKLLQKLVGPVFNHIANSLVEAFVHRATQLYGAA